MKAYAHISCHCYKCKQPQQLFLKWGFLFLFNEQYQKQPGHLPQYEHARAMK